MATLADARPRDLHPLWLMPSVMTFVAFYEKVFNFGGLVVAFCRVFLDFSRIFWERLFALLPGGYLHGDAATYDLMTLWLTSSVAIWVFPLLTPAADGRVKTTVTALSELLRLPVGAARLLGFFAIAAAIVVIALPFGAFSASPGTLIDTLQRSEIISGGTYADWLSGDGLWFSALLLAFGLCALSFVYFVIGPRLSAAELTDEEKRDLIVIAVALWVVSAALLAAAVLIAPGQTAFGLGKQDAMVCSLLALVGLVAWRSALPFVQLAVLIVSAVIINEVFQFLLGVWQAASGG